jgi:RimJ/RimL family protein N-acetyltransferase
MQPIILETERLILRPFNEDDGPALVRLAGAREVAEMTLRIPYPYTAADAEEFIARNQANAARGLPAPFAIALKAGTELTGAIGLDVDAIHRRAELGYWVGVPFWGRGYASEAARAVILHGFDRLGLHKIFAVHFSHNPASGRVLQKIGMKHEGHLREHDCKWGKFFDLEMYGILHSDLQTGKT